MTRLALSSQILTLIGGVVERYAGLHHEGRNLDLFFDKVSERASEAGFESLLDYYYLLRYDDAAHAELDQLIDVLVVGETYFFREAEALAALVETLGERSVAGQRARIWSAGCATGEEPVTLAILLERASLRGSADIVASDISHRALRRARTGEYGLSAHRAHPEGLEPAIQISRGRAVVDERIRAAIDWRYVNLVDAASVAKLGSFDAILCRNVLLYFADATAERVTGGLARALRPGGRLLIGACESLLRVSSELEPESRGGVFFYRRRAA